jgi:hypothetical protein
MNEVTIKNIDWALLRQQKAWLVEQAPNWAFSTCESNANGLICLLDALQDEAVKQGLSESLVFGEE